MYEGMHPPLPKIGRPRISQELPRYNTYVHTDKIYNALHRNRIEPKIDNIHRKNQKGFRRNRSTISQILTICQILESVRLNNLQATLLFVDFLGTQNTST